MVRNYVIVGKRHDDDNMNYLHSDGSIDTNPKKGGVLGKPLTVEFIGEKMVELAENPVKAGSAEYNRAAELIKAAMIVRGPEGHNPSDIELVKILDEMVLELAFDERIRHDGQTDKNTRILVVPVSEALKHRQQQFAALGSAPGFVPPLTYILDRQLMKANFLNQIQQAVADFRDVEGESLSDDVQMGLLNAIDLKLGSLDDQVADGDPMKQYMENVLNEPVAAFHRAVGIYITEMCN